MPLQYKSSFRRPGFVFTFISTRHLSCEPYMQVRYQARRGEFCDRLFQSVSHSDTLSELILIASSEATASASVYAATFPRDSQPSKPRTPSLQMLALNPLHPRDRTRPGLNDVCECRNPGHPE